MKTLLFTVSLIIMISACSKDSDCPECDPTQPDILGTWTALQTNDQGEQLFVDLSFYTDNTFLWMVADTSYGNISTSAGYTLSGDILTFLPDPECNNNGIYFVSVKGNKLALMSREDSCAARVRGLEWIWTKK